MDLVGDDAPRPLLLAKEGELGVVAPGGLAPGQSAALVKMFF